MNISKTAGKENKKFNRLSVFLGSYVTLSTSTACVCFNGRSSFFIKHTFIYLRAND